MKEFQQLDGFRRTGGMKRAELDAIRDYLRREIKKTDAEIEDIRRQIALFENAMAERGREVEERRAE